jgi:hypothetical protein
VSEEARVWAKRQNAPCAISKAMLLELAAMANTLGECWPSVRYLAEMFGVSMRSVQRYIAKLKDAELLIATAQTRPNGGQTSNLYRLPLSEAYRSPTLEAEARRAPHDTTVAPSSDTIVGPPTTTASPPIGSENLTQETSDEVSPRRREVEEGFAKWWAIYPRKVEQRPALKLFERIVRKRQATVDQLCDGAQRYAIAVHGRDPAMVKHPATWLQREAWVEGAPSPNAEASVTQNGSTMAEFAGPAELREAIVAVRGEAWTHSWIDPCGWDATANQLVPRTGFAATRITQELGRRLRDWGLTVGEPQRSKA